MDKVLEIFSNAFSENDVIVCATSGGVDSMTLLKLLIDFNNKYKNIKIICAHINHNLRKESFEEYEFVKNYCENNNIIFEGITFEKNKSGNFESQSRKKRYVFFDEIVKKYNAKYLLTAHHGDDLVETILMRLVRGSTLDGYRGFDIISDRDNYKIFRPFVYYSKNDIEKYAIENKIEYREDITNFDTKYTRNRYRKNILPLLKEENPDVHLKFLKFSKTIKEQTEFVNNYINEIYNRVYIKGKISINEFKIIDKYIQKKIILKVLGEIYKENIVYINDKHVDNIIDVINSSKPNLSINLPLNINATKNYNYLEIKSHIELKDYEYEIKGEDIILPNGGILKMIDNTSLTNNYVCHLNSSNIKLPLYVRNKRDGDFIEILGLNGKKKLKDIFINEKVDKEKRYNYPVVVDSNNTILWLPGLKKSKYDSLKTKNYDIILWYINEEEKNE